LATSTSAFSQDPLINWLGRHVALLLTGGFALGVAYMSLIPFDFVAAPAWDPTAKYIGYLRLNDISMTDVIANIGIYVPLGGLAFWGLRRRGVWRLVALIGALFFGYLLSFSIEHAQHWLDARVSSWVDVVANSLGTLLGAMMAFFIEPFARRILIHLSHNAERNWYMLLAKLAACCLLVASLRPFDVVIDVRSAAAALPRANYLFEAKWQQLPAMCKADIENHQRKGMFELDRMRVDYVIDRVVDVVVYTGLTVLCCTGLMVGGMRGFWSVSAYAGLLVQTLSVLIVFIRHFLSSWGMDTAHFACAMLGWGLGVAIFAYTRWVKRKSDEDEPRGATLAKWLQSKPVMIVTAMLAVVTVVGYELSPFQFETTDGVLSWRKVNLVPFQPHFLNRPNRAMFDITGEMLRYGTLAFCLISLAFNRFGIANWRRHALACIGICTVASVFAELSHLFIRTRTADITTVFLAATAAAIACATFRALFDLRRFVMTQYADDLLTSQLVEGDTYDKEAAKKLAKSRGDVSPKAATRSGPPD